MSAHRLRPGVCLTLQLPATQLHPHYRSYPTTHRFLTRCWTQQLGASLAGCQTRQAAACSSALPLCLTCCLVHFRSNPVLTAASLDFLSSSLHDFMSPIPILQDVCSFTHILPALNAFFVAVPMLSAASTVSLFTPVPCCWVFQSSSPLCSRQLQSFPSCNPTQLLLDVAGEPLVCFP